MRLKTKQFGKIVTFQQSGIYFYVHYTRSPSTFEYVKLLRPQGHLLKIRTLEKVFFFLCKLVLHLFYFNL